MMFTDRMMSCHFEGDSICVRFFNDFNYSLLWIHSENSRLMMLYKIDVLKNFTKFTGKHMYLSLFLIKASSLQL